LDLVGRNSPAMKLIRYVVGKEELLEHHFTEAMPAPKSSQPSSRLAEVGGHHNDPTASAIRRRQPTASYGNERTLADAAPTGRIV
jgi:hypothetical protein